MSSSVIKEFPSDREILGFNRWWVFVCAFLAISVISPYEYAWSSMADRIGGIYGWSHNQIGLMFTLFVVFQSFGTLPGGILRDKFGPRMVSIVSGIIGSLGILACAWGPNYTLVLVLWCIGSFFVGFVYNASVTTCNKWFPDKRGLTAGLIAGAFSWGALPFIFPIRAIPATAPDSVFFSVLFVMAAIIGGVVVITALFMKDPPAGWRPAGWVPSKGSVRPSDHQYSMGEAMGTWQFWVLIVSFILISSAGLTGVAKIVQYSKSFGFGAAAATAGAGGVAIMNGLGRVVLGQVSEKIGRENAMIFSYILTAVFLVLSIIFGEAHMEYPFVIAAILAIFFWGPLFSLFPAVVGNYYGDLAAGSNYGLLYAIAKGSGGIYGGVLSAILISSFGFSVTIAVAAGMAFLAGIIVIPLRTRPPVWQDRPEIGSAVPAE